MRSLPVTIRLTVPPDHRFVPFVRRTSSSFVLRALELVASEDLGEGSAYLGGLMIEFDRREDAVSLREAVQEVIESFPYDEGKLMTGRQSAGLQERVDARRFRDADVRDLLDELSVDDLVFKYGEPSHRVAYRLPWHRPAGRPALYDDDPAVMQMIGRCAANRVRSGFVVDMPLATSGFHPAECGWCQYPVEELLAACEWAVQVARYLSSELLVWTNHDSSATYIREGPRTGTYINPAWAAFYALSPEAREERVRQLRLGV